ncbi:MAG TPA: C13 family peptidase [Noviherbaspirillum sp.]|jgi:hypothetical protein|uniref:C13 family peptidase n=1 Tax=Noviherbaspirillum sp. TaxID=1926288 RepID=UPI002DDD4E50|nr:C13 family peptidase [Noviherbaspirillum sp.]HEV2612105.1 C13 family peptidase [Noviherbaspirillum sp.]
MIEQVQPGTALLPPARPSIGLAAWYREGARTAFFQWPAWQGLAATPSLIAILVLWGLALTIALERLYLIGPAEFYWQAIAGGWLSTLVTAWTCYLMRPHASSEPDRHVAPDAAHLFAMAIAQSQVLTLIVGLMFAALLRSPYYNQHQLGAWGMWTVWLIPTIWMMAAQLTLLWRAGSRRPGPMLAVVAIAIGMTALLYAARPAEFWYPAEPENTQVERPRLRLTQETMEAQPLLLSQRLQAMPAQRPGMVDLYAITFAPYADEEVFRRESDMVSQVMAQRFDATGRTLQLVNNPGTLEQWPWATPLNFKRAILHVAGLMDKEEDLLFLHLTSHGARNGELAASFWPMSVDTVKPSDLKAWLDEAGVKYRVISISACYSGSWIEPLADENSLLMTASDAEHTSYGCGRKSELTFFGRAMYDEQLRNKTLSFQEAHAAAREVIRQREEEAGKQDGYSNPQIRVGAAVQARLMQMQEQLKKTANR